MNYLNATAHYLKSHWWYLSIILLIGLCTAFFTYIQSIPTFPDPDSFYHVEMSQLIPEQGVITQFPWLQFSVLKDSYTNQHFLYHVFLIPFTHVMDPIQGAKVAQVMLNTAFIVLFYWLLRRERVPGAFLFALLLLVTTSFMFRLNLVKAPVVSLLFLFFGIYCLYRYKYVALFFTAAAYVWAYGGFVVLLIASGAYALIAVLQDWFRRGNHQPFSVVARNSKELRMFGITLGGMVAGILINPQFPENLLFYWRQLVAIGVVNYQNVISVGGEWYPYNIVDLGRETLFITILLVLCIALVVWKWRAPSRKQLLSAFLFLLFLAFTLKSRRYVEYYVPTAALAVAMTIKHYFGSVDWHRVSTWFRTLATRYLIITLLMVAYLGVMIPAVAVKDLAQLDRDYRGGISVNRFSGAGAWLRQNVRPGEIVFHSSWDEFPILFYRDPTAYYISGLDPTFSYEYDGDLWNTIVDITTGKQREGVYEAIRDTFGARYVFVEANHDAMRRVVESSGNFIRMYSDDEAAIYYVKPATL